MYKNIKNQNDGFVKSLFCSIGFIKEFLGVRRNE